MDRLKQIEAFVSAATRGSLSAAARIEGVTPAIIGRRLDALEARLGVKLLLRTTRKLTITFEGQAFLEDCQKTLNDLANAEAAVSLGGVRASGQLRVSAPSGFGRRHVAPLVGDFMLANPEVTVNLDLSDRLVDLLNENIDCAIRIGELTDSSLVSVRLGEMRRMVVASPAYLVAHGVPREPADLAAHNCLSLGQQRGWVFRNRRHGRHDQGWRYLRMQRRCRSARMGAGRPRPGLALAVGSRAGSEGRGADLGARCLAGAADGYLRRLPATPPLAAARAPVH
jgi:DNA-binding transcriptional LysR family regulator